MADVAVPSTDAATVLKRAQQGKGYWRRVWERLREDKVTLAVIGVLMTPGRVNQVFNKIVSTMSEKEGPPVNADRAINPSGLLPAARSYYRYSGSLTTPPCSETVDWLLLTDSIQVADADIARFAKLYPMNARPVQKANRRFVLRSA